MFLAFICMLILGFTLSPLQSSAQTFGECLEPLIIGGESRKSDCGLEIQVVNPNNDPFFDRRGLVNPNQTCTDGDKTCDFDEGVNGSCMFRMASCFNCTDPALPTCVADNIFEYGVFSPKITSRRSAVDRDNAQALVNAALAMGGGMHPKRSNVVLFDPPLSGPQCTAYVEIQVPLRVLRDGSLRMKRYTVRTRGIFEPYAWDADYLRLICKPAEAE